ncbi:uncharacterized protein LOC135339062 isoform X3 [Halichondria panicea]|uniref:uncharacterized protein LOC135339062 isoform X3 n=1 Tax=Halichondria panicea TaxID=6063 RepID=UPI00312BA579
MDDYTSLTFLLLAIAGTFTVAVKAQQFTIEPESVVRAEGLLAEFKCLSPGALAHPWFVSGIQTTSPNSSFEIRVAGGTSGHPSVLTIPASLQFNNSVIQCLAASVTSVVFSRNATLIVERVSIKVVNSETHLTVAVTNIFTLNNDTYRVDILLTALGTNEMVALPPLNGQTNQAQFNYGYPNHTVCDILTFIMTPISESGMEGRSSEPAVPGFFTRVTGDSIAPLISQNEDVLMKIVTLIDVVPNCRNFTHYQIDSDALPGPITEIIQYPLTVLSFPLPSDIITNVTVTLTALGGVELIFQNIAIRTTDVQNLTVDVCPEGNCISVSIEYVEGTLSPGALVCVIRITDGELDFGSIKVITIPHSRSENFTILAVPSGNYRVITFDLERNFLPRMPISIAADSKDISVTVSSGDGGQPPSCEGVSVTKLPNGDAQVTCADSDVVCLVLFQSTIALDRILVALIDSFASSTTFSVSDTFANGHVIVYSWNSSQSIFDGKVSLIRQLNSPTSPSTLSPTDPPAPVTGSQFPLATGVIAGLTVVVILLLLVVIVVGAGIVVGLKKRQKMQNEDGRVDWCSTFPGIEQPNEAYAPVLKIKRNITYEQTKKPQIDETQALATTEGEYESIDPVHEYEDVLPKTNL